MSTSGRKPLGLVAGLAWADIKHEWILSLCLFLAVAAVVGPLLLLFGLKSGTMETLRMRLLEDPRNREIRPMVSRSFTPEWLEELAANQGVAFLVPATRSISASVELSLPGKKGLTLEAEPSGTDDPLLMENGATPPKGRECVLSVEAARKLSAKVGDELELLVKRLKGRSFEAGRLRLKVSGVLESRATTRDVAYFPLELLEAIESFKDGQAVAAYGWKGSTPLARPVYDGVLLGLNRPLDPVLRVKLTSGTGLSKVRDLPEAEQLSELGYKVAGFKHTYLITTKRSLGKEVLATMKSRLRGKRALVLPWVKSLEIKIGDEEPALPLYALPKDKAAANNTAPWQAGLEPGPAWRQVMLPEGSPLGEATLSLAGEDATLSFPVEVKASTSSKAALAPPELAGVLNLTRRRDVSWLKDEDRFILKRRGYASFRLYAASLEDVEPLKLKLEAMDIPVHTEAARIRDLKELDRHLGMIFWLIALGGLLGGAGCLSASLYASVERKRRDLGVLGLLGFSRGQLLGFPLYQALFLSLGGFGLALGFYGAMAWFIDRLFAGHLAGGESFCRLSPEHMILAGSGVFILGQIAAALAAWRVITIDPAEALRDE